MTINEVAGLLGYSKERVDSIIADGMALPRSGTIVKFALSHGDGKVDISDHQFDEFVAKFELEEPGRSPGAGIRRDLLVEARHCCAICRKGPPLQFHHMLEWGLCPSI